MRSMKKVFALMLFAVCVLSALTACGQNKAVSYNADGIVRIAYSEIDPICEDDELALAGWEILKAMQDSNSILLSLVVDSTIEITEEELSGYDHLIITNPEWIEKFDEISNLTVIEYDNIPTGIQDFLTSQMPLWTNDGGVLPNGITFYKYSGDGLLAFPVNVGEHNETIEAKKPLIVMVENPATSMNAKGFLLPLTSSGNLIFTDAKKLQAELEGSLISPYVLEVESIESK